MSEQCPPPLGQGDSGFRHPGEVGAGQGRPPPRRPIQRAAGKRGWERIRDCSAGGLPSGCLQTGRPRLLTAVRFLSSPSPALTSCKPPAESLPSSGPALGPASPKGQAVSGQGPPTPHSSLCCPRTCLPSATSPSVDQIPWDLLLTTERPPPPTGVPGQHSPIYLSPLDGDTRLTGPHHHLSPSLHPSCPRAAAGTPPPAQTLQVVFLGAAD